MTNNKIAVFGGGCFWCTETVFKQLAGVNSVLPGYAGGNLDNPSYQDVSSGATGHAEVIKIEFDPTIIPFADLVDVFLNTHNPTSLNRQGNDVGSQYRSVIFYTTSDQRQIANNLINEINRSGQYPVPLVTEVAPFTKFYPAENYHLNYYANHKDDPYCQFVINPKLRKLREKYPKKLKNTQGVQLK